MLKKILLALVFMITAITNVTYAEDDMKTVASKAYVDTKIETKQLKIPAAGQPNVGAGETVMTYTATGNGQIGERGLYSDISSYDATTDGDKLITASALNATFTNLPTTPTTKLECANQADGCTLWTIVDQTAYHRRPSKNLFDKDSTNIKHGWYNYADQTIGAELREFASSSRFYTSAPIPVIMGATYTVVGTGGATPSFIYVDKDLKYVDGFTNSQATSRTFTVPNNPSIKYLLFPFAVDTVDTCQLELGSTATPYEPYY